MKQWLSQKAILSRFALASLAMCLFAGCGDGGQPVTGTVNFAGKPVPAGKIYFMPDESKGNTGAPGYATIENGAYDTSAAGGKSPIAGPMIVKIEGFDPNAKATTAPGDTSGEVVVKSLFPQYETTAEVTGEGPLNFDVPASAAERKDAPEQRMITP